MCKKNIWSVVLIFIIFFFSVMEPKAQSQGKTDFLYFTSSQISTIKDEIKSHDKRIMPFVKILKQLADKMLQQGPWTITSVHANTPSGDPHEYFSEGTYWWPNPKDINGPYIRKDGLRYPGRFMAHRKMLDKMYAAVYWLSIAAYFLDDQEYANHAAKIISVWYLDPKTKMNPNLMYAQAIKGITPGRGIGIIDMHRFSMFPTAINLLEASGKWNKKDYEGLKNWFKQYLEWITTSKNGIEEKNNGNNHSTWWEDQAMAYSIFLNDTSMYNRLIKFFKTDLIPKQIMPNGSCPKEEARTKSLQYSIFNVEAFALLCRMAMLKGDNLWNYKTNGSGSVNKTINYLIPFMKQPDKWKKEEIIPFKVQQPLFLALAYISLKNPEYKDLYLKMGKLKSKKSNEQFNDPFNFLVDMVLVAEQ